MAEHRRDQATDPAAGVVIDRVARYLWFTESNDIGEHDWNHDIGDYRARARRIVLEPDGWHHAER